MRQLKDTYQLRKSLMKKGATFITKGPGYGGRVLPHPPQREKVIAETDT